MPSPLGHKPKLEWIKLTQLYVPTEYQRSTKSMASQSNINRLREKFNWAECGALIVSPLNSKPPQYAIIDGQHRFKAAELHGGITELPCCVLEQKDTAAQAGNFVGINTNRVALHMLPKYHAAVVAGDPDAVSLAAILKKCKISIADQAMNMKTIPARTTTAVGTLLRMIGDYSEKQMIWVLTIIPEAYGEAKGALRPNLIRTLARFIKFYPDADRKIMIAALEETDLNELEKDARGHCKVSGGTMAAAMMVVIKRRYDAIKKAA